MRAAAPLLLLLTCLFFGCENRDAPPVGTAGPETATAAPPLEWKPVTYADSTALRPRGPYFTYQLSTVEATGGDPRVRQLINDTLATLVLGRSLPPGTSLEDAVPREVERRFADYRNQELEEEWLQEAPISFSEAEDQQTEVLFQSDALVVLAHHYYAYTGGAHGNYATTLLPVATTPPRRLTYDELFLPGSARHVSRLLTQRADSLTGGGLYVDTVPVTDNLAPLPDGVRFVYAPYDIAPYAAGEVVIDLPYATLRPWLREGVEALVATE